MLALILVLILPPTLILLALVVLALTDGYQKNEKEFKKVLTNQQTGGIIKLQKGEGKPHKPERETV